MENFIKFMSGKKSLIASVIWLVVSYLTAKWLLWESEVVLIMWLSWIFFWKLSMMTQKQYKKD